MANIFDDDRIHFPEDTEMRVFGSIEKLAQWRHRNVGPDFIRIGRRIGYHGKDLNAYLSAQRTDPSTKAAYRTTRSSKSLLLKVIAAN